MRTITCDKCGIVLNPKKDAHYSISSLDFSNPSCKTILIRETTDGEEMKRIEATQSWVEYTDIDFCVPCFDTTGFKEFLVKEKD